MKYEVFARINQGDDTKHIGNVTAESDRLAKMYAHNTFNEEDWDFLAVINEADLLEVTGGRPELEVSASE
ncbi:phenylacetic acid degradation PaaB family protein [Halosolutus gelatinilyticus]|uniref:phenylacetic acid degradation PaaB family protein n=1 Tax=Halosolutus gelatinilyticus TaxID=2931975 RepID=UPI001FF436FC|nr:phenylacetic acid degradation PaaB family protein [Halosolutus gelatinilyticus]